MKRLTTVIATSLTMLLGINPSYAQDGPVNWAPMEIFGCSFVDDSDMDDLDGVIDSFNEFMDANEINDYTAIVLTPHFTAATFPYDVLWVGVWENGAALGGMQLWLTEGGDVAQDFADVIDCPLHQAFAVNAVRQMGEPTGIVPVEFTDCTIQEGRIGPEARAAIVEWTDYLAENGSEAGHFILRPGPGEESDATYSFKWVTSYPSWTAIGQDFETLFNGGGGQRYDDIIGRVMSCDYPRLYNSRVVRSTEE